MPANRVARALAAVAPIAMAAALLGGCGGDSGDAGPDAKDGAAHGGASPVAAGARQVEVTARSFAFDPAEIKVRTGEDIAIVLRSLDSTHDFTLEELGAHVASDMGSTAIGGLRAERPGRYRFYCSVAGHRQAGMEGVLVVED